jgi:hypothetical protein
VGSSKITFSNIPEAYLFQTPFYGEEHPEWSIAMSVRNTRDFERFLQLYTDQETSKAMDRSDAYRFEDGFVCMKTVCILEVNENFDVETLLKDMDPLIQQFRHPLLLPTHLLFRHIEETTKKFSEIERLLGEIEHNIMSFSKRLDEFSRTNQPGKVLTLEFGSLYENLYKCDTLFNKLERRFDFENKFGNLVLKALCWGYKKCRVTGDNEKPLVSWFADINKLHRTARLAERVQATLDTSQGRTGDMKSFLDKLKLLKKMVNSYHLLIVCLGS